MCVGGMGQTLLRGRELVGFGVRNLPPMVRVTTGKAAFPVASGLVWTGFGDIDHDHRNLALLVQSQLFLELSG